MKTAIFVPDVMQIRTHAVPAESDDLAACEHVRLQSNKSNTVTSRWLDVTCFTVQLPVTIGKIKKSFLYLFMYSFTIISPVTAELFYIEVLLI